MFFPIALVIVAPVALWLGHRVGDTVPFLLGFAVAAFDIWVVPGIPHSPAACVTGHPVCGQQQAPWLIALVFVIPLAVVIGYKLVRGDKRGSKGRRLP